MSRFLCVSFLLLAGRLWADTDFATQMVEATFQLTNKESNAAGFFILPPEGAGEPGPVLVTAKHVFSKMVGDQATLVLRDAKPDGTYERRNFPFAVRTGEKPLWTEHPSQDVAVMRVALPEDAHVEALPFEALATEEALKAIALHVTQEVHVLGYPTNFTANPAGFPVARHASVASYPIWPISKHQTILLDFATFAGDSGGPVFLADPREPGGGEYSRPLILGLVLSQFFNTEHVTSRYEQATLNHPLSLATALHAQAIRETIEQFEKEAGQ